jgi:hypothetical protein
VSLPEGTPGSPEWVAQFNPQDPAHREAFRAVWTSTCTSVTLWTEHMMQAYMSAFDHMAEQMRRLAEVLGPVEGWELYDELAEDDGGGMPWSGDAMSWESDKDLPSL